MITASASLLGALAAAGVFGDDPDPEAQELRTDLDPQALETPGSTPSSTASSTSTSLPTSATSATTATAPSTPRPTRSTPDPDGDGDGIPDAADNCTRTSNPDQADFDDDGLGDVCDDDDDGDHFADGIDGCQFEPAPDTADGCPLPVGGYFLNAPESVMTDNDAPTSHPGIRVAVTVVSGGHVSLSGSGACGSPSDLSGGTGELWQFPVLRLGTCEIVAVQQATPTHTAGAQKVHLAEITGS